ncbi:hypothetical protein BJEO58_01789 [Brevibacterium jeotgali]|uniref:Uncharacterized protein n=1 Tax=Brevibacterium jeotgali TaxID=1262550 RepID=A0A2H1L616_9MICO|nr:hypothetical protein BJEO58_01789 [Brevibacterium jeotgali]
MCAGTADRMTSFEIVSAIPTPAPRIAKAMSSPRSDPAWPLTRITPYPTAFSSSPPETTAAGVNTRTSHTAVSPATIVTARPGSRKSPASSGLRPLTSCRCCEMKKRNPTRENTLSRFAARAPLNAGTVNSRTSSMGRERRSCRRTKSAPLTSPTRTAAAEAPVTPAYATSLTAHTMGAIVAMTRTMLAGSMGLGSGSLDSGISHRPSARSGMRTGTASSSTEPHQKCSSRTPPTMGPSAAPPENPAAHTAIAVRRSVGSAKTLRMIDRVAGISIAPKNPSAARATMSAAAVGANAAHAETTAKPRPPTMSSRRRPTESPRLPIGTRSPASTSG